MKMPSRHRTVLILLIPLTAAAIALLGATLIQPAPTSADDFYLTSAAYLSAANAQWLELIAFAPLIVALAFAWQHEEPNVDYFQPEMVGVFGWWIAFANGYAVAYTLTLAGMLPKFEPVIQSLNDPRLRAVPINFPALGLVLGTVIFFVWFIFRRKHGFGGMADRISLPHRRVARLILLAMLAVFVWLFGGVTFAALIVPPMWLWILIEPRQRRLGRVMNITLAVGGVAAYVIIALLLPRGLMLWHILLAAAYGVFPPLDVLPFLLLMALFIRFLRSELSAPYEPPSEQTRSASETLRV